LIIGILTKKTGFVPRGKLGLFNGQYYEENFHFGKILQSSGTRKLVEVLRNWLATGDGSRFSRFYLEFPEIRELLESGRVQVLKVYASQLLR
jgi:hypothetical protein